MSRTRANPGGSPSNAEKDRSVDATWGDFAECEGSPTPPRWRGIASDALSGVEGAANPTLNAETPTLDSGLGSGGSSADASMPVAPPSWLQAIWQKAIDCVFDRHVPAMLVSMIVHTVLLIVLAIWTISFRGGGGSYVFESNFVENEEGDLIETLQPIQLASGDSEPAPNVSTGSTAISDVATTSNLSSSLSSISQSIAEADVLESSIASTPTQSLIEATQSSTVSSLGHAGIDGRSPGKRRQLAMERGGSAESEAAVERALDWIAAHQRANGSWSLVHTKPDCQGACMNEGSKERYDPAATGLALLAYLGAGYTHREGKHADVVRRGVYYLLQVLEETPQGGSFLYNCPQGMYNHGIASFALCEAYQLSGDESLREPAQKAINFTCHAQNAAGGWGYLPKQPGDLTLTGWQVMALKSAHSAGLVVSTTTIRKLDHFLDSQTDEGRVFYGYSVPGKTQTCTSIGLLLRIFRGWHTTDPRVVTGMGYLMSEGISPTDLYRDYYVTLLLYNVGGRVFDDWNKPMREYLVRTQSRQGHAAGSWHFPDRYGDQGGRLYSTAMSAMILEVYYRFSPLYLNMDKPFEL